jgi:ketosteroid isomerase-like protein
MSRSSALGERVLDYFRLVDQGRLDEMYDMYTDDIVYKRAGVEPIIGKAALIAFFQGPRGIDRIRHEMKVVAVEGNCVVVEGRAQATLLSGGSFDRQIAEFFWFEGDRIARRHGYVDAAL